MPNAGICVLSIDVIHDNARTAKLCRQFSGAGVPVVWGLSSSPSDELADAIGGHSGSEVALLADGWASEPADRRVFSQSLTGALDKLRATGVRPTTLSLSAGILASHDDLLVKHAIRAVRVSARRSTSTARRASKLGEMQVSNCLWSLRWGLWEALVSVDLRKAGLSAAWRTIDRLCDGGGVAIVAASSDILSADSKTASRLIGHLTERRQQAVRLTTLAAIVNELTASRRASARSILRPAA